MSGSARDIIDNLFTYRQLSAINAVLSRKEINSLTLTEFHSIVGASLKKKIKNRIPAYKTRKVRNIDQKINGVELCGECNVGILKTLQLNTGANNIVEGGYTHMTLCSVCMSEKYFIDDKEVL